MRTSHEASNVVSFGRRLSVSAIIGPSDLLKFQKMLALRFN